MSKHCPACNSDELAKINGEWVECPGIEVDEWHPASEPPTPEDFEPTGWIQILKNGIPSEVTRRAFNLFGRYEHWRKITPP